MGGFSGSFSDLFGGSAPPAPVAIPDAFAPGSISFSDKYGK
jgi:hypothetical protein